jgi:hypothetical protein
MVLSDIDVFLLRILPFYRLWRLGPNHSSWTGYVSIHAHIAYSIFNTRLISQAVFIIYALLAV